MVAKTDLVSVLNKETELKDLLGYGSNSKPIYHITVKDKHPISEPAHKLLTEILVKLELTKDLIRDGFSILEEESVDDIFNLGLIEEKVKTVTDIIKKWEEKNVSSKQKNNSL